MQPLLYNTLYKKKEKFVPIDEKKIGIYACGPTVYDLAHIGNARPIIVFDVLFRLLRYIYGDEHVTYVRNITDVDDKINARAKEENLDITEITNRTIKQFHADISKLCVLEPSIEPKATDHIEIMVDMITRLKEYGHAYEKEGHVYFAVKTMKDYGELSSRNLDEIISGARVEVSDLKDDPLDFVLWKPSTDDLPGWDSPWGRGRPGWHIECSSMSSHYLGNIIDIHTGGEDLIFPHHENEIAQSRCANKTSSFANYWLHNGYLMVEGKKMSKSLGNFFTINDLLQKFPGEALRLAMLMTLYRQKINWMEKSVHEAITNLDNWYGLLQKSIDLDKSLTPDQEFMDALCDDLNTPKAISLLHKFKNMAEKGDRYALSQLLICANLIGLLLKTPDSWFLEKAEFSLKNIDENEIKGLINERNHARQARDFAMADQIRDKLKEMGISILDSKDGTTWKFD